MAAYENLDKDSQFRNTDVALPEWIQIKIDPRRPTQYTLLQIGRYLKEVKRVFKIREVRPRTGQLCPLYKTYVLKKLGFSGRDLKC